MHCMQNKHTANTKCKQLVFNGDTCYVISMDDIITMYVW